MKNYLFIVILIFSYHPSIANAWKNYHGILNTLNEKLDIELKILFLDQGVIIGSYRERGNSIQCKLVGNIRNDSLELTIRLSSNDSIQGFLIGELTRKQKRFNGDLINKMGDEIGKFKLKQVFDESYTDIIQTHRALYEYTSFEEALTVPKEVKSIDVARQQLKEIPDIFDQFRNLVSINLLGNRLDSFPVSVIKARRLKELSLSSNGLSIVGEELGELKELRILIMNFNNIQDVPKEIGNLTELLYLDLGDNEISTFPSEIGNLINLEELHVDDNKLSEDEMNRLQELLPNCVIHFGNQRE